MIGLVRILNRASFIFICFILTTIGYTENSPLIFPVPQEMNLLSGYFELDENTKILLSETATEHDLFLARLLITEFGENYLFPLNMEKRTVIPSDEKFMLLGTVSNPLINELVKIHQLSESLKKVGDEGYILKISDQEVIVAANTDQGVFYGFQTFRQLIKKNQKTMVIPRVEITDKPTLPFRGIRLYIPGRENIPFFKRFIRDFMSLYKFNKLILEVNGVMRLDRHPEINVGALEFAQEMNYSRRDRPEGPGNQYQNSAHHDAGDGQILEKEEVANLVDYIRQFHIDVIPEIPSLTHSYYLLNRHRELAEIQNAEWPDTYCPSNPESYKLIFDVFDEYVEVIQPKIIHLGKDEWRMPVNICPLCRGKDYRELFIQDIQKVYFYLKNKDIKVGMWGDHFLESVRSKGFRDRRSSSGYEYQMPGALTPQQVIDAIPKDILIFNWFWGDATNDQAVAEFGFKQVYGNFRPNISAWENRSKNQSILGGAPSSWAATTELNFGKDLLYDFLGCANLLWSQHYLPHSQLAAVVRDLVPKIQRRLSVHKLPSMDNNKIVSVDIQNNLNTLKNSNILGENLSSLKSGQLGESQLEIVDTIDTKNKIAVTVFCNQQDQGNFPDEVSGIDINEDVSSLIFLHACAREAGNEKGYRMIYNFEDTADLLGWYEVVYEDGYLETIPIRYGINILDINIKERDQDQWEEGKTGSPQNVYGYQTTAVECSQDKNDSKMFFAYEWINPRFGKTISCINLKGVKGFKNYSGKTIPENAVILLAISKVEQRKIPSAR